MRKRLTKELVKQWLDEADSWEIGHAETFEYDDYSLCLRKEEETYWPYQFTLHGGRYGRVEEVGRRYLSLEEALLHMANGFNDNALTHNRYASIEELLHDPRSLLTQVNTKITYFYHDSDGHLTRNEVVVAGFMTNEQKKTIQECLKDDIYFTPSQVGLPEDRGAGNKAEYSWFEWELAERTARKPTLNMTIDELTSGFVQVSKSAAPDAKYPYKVRVYETLRHAVIVWATDSKKAEELAVELSDNGTIEVTDRDFLCREIECDGFAQTCDLDTLEHYGME